MSLSLQEQREIFPVYNEWSLHLGTGIHLPMGKLARINIDNNKRNIFNKQNQNVFAVFNLILIVSKFEMLKIIRFAFLLK